MPQNTTIILFQGFVGAITPMDNLVYNATIEWFPGFVYVLSCFILVIQGFILVHMLLYIRNRKLQDIFTQEKLDKEKDETSALVEDKNKEETVAMRDL